MSWTSQQEVSPVPQPDRGIQERLISLQQTHLQGEAVVAVFLWDDQEGTSSRDLENHGGLPGYLLDIFLEQAIGAIFDHFKLVLHLGELRVEIVAFIAREDGADPQLDDQR